MSTARRIYLDHQATTPLDGRVADAMAPWASVPGNPHAGNQAGRAAAAAVEAARESVAALIGAHADEIVFTSGATEGANIAIRSLARRGARAVSSPIEHACVLTTLADLPGVELDLLPIARSGVVAAEDVAEALEQPAALVAVMGVSN